MAKRAGENPFADILEPNLQPFQLQPIAENIGTKNATSANELPSDSNPRRRRTALQGPCSFGCVATTERSRGKQVWRRVPEPSPWNSVPSGATICRKCYDRAMVIVRRNRLVEADNNNRFLSYESEQNVVDVRPFCAASSHGCLPSDDGPSTLCRVPSFLMCKQESAKQAWNSAKTHGDVKDNVGKTDAKSYNFNDFLDKQCDALTRNDRSQMAVELLFGVISKKQ